MNIGINGFGRIGRLALRAALLRHPDVTVSAINTSGSMDMDGWAYLFKYDTAYGKFPKKITVKAGEGEHEIGRLVVNGYNDTIPFFAVRNPEEIPWGSHNVHTVLESTGIFRKRDDALKHLKGGAQKIIISAPPKGGDIPLCLLKLNQDIGKEQSVISNGSCTTYSAAPVIRIIYDHFGIERASLTTIHAYTSDQRLTDGSHPNDIRRARAAGQNIIPTSSGAAESIVAVIPEMEGKFEATSLRVPVITGSLSDITFLTEKPVTTEEVNAVFKNEANGRYKGLIEATDDPIVSSDVIGNSASAIIDLSLTNVIGRTMLKVFSWYDNEWSYACRLVELAAQLA